MIRWFQWLLYWYWRTFLDGLLRKIEQLLGLERQEDWAGVAWKAGITFLFLLVLYEIYARIRNALHERNIRRTMRGHEIKADIYETKDQRFTEELDAVQHPLSVLEELKKQKNYGRMGEILAKLNQPGDAAKWFIKDRQYKRAAEELAKAGKTRRAARLLWRCGDYATAARLYLETGGAKKAAIGFERAGMIAEAAQAYAQAGRFARGMECFSGYFLRSQESIEMQARIADLCYQLLHDPANEGKGDDAVKRALLREVGDRFDMAGRTALAAQTLAEAGEYGRAAELYSRIGDRAMAQRCFDAMHGAGGRQA